jgi:quercetin dioxygenase-like cupin family protein
VSDRFPVAEVGRSKEVGERSTKAEVGVPIDQSHGSDFRAQIAPGRAPNHSHFYDEIVYIIDGEGILHLGGEQKVIGPGSAIHLPPLAEHCLENTGKGSMRVLGVFHPSGDPASRAHESE